MDNQVDKDTIDYGARLQLLRKNSDLTQVQVAEVLGLQAQTISQYERNQRKPDYAILRKLANLYSTTIDYMLYNDNRVCIVINDLPDSKQKLILGIVDDIRKEYDETKK